MEHKIKNFLLLAANVLVPWPVHAKDKAFAYRGRLNNSEMIFWLNDAFNYAPGHALYLYQRP